MKFNAINEKFTAKVSEYLAKGYIINVSSMAGHQGEIGKVDLVKGEEFIRVWMDKEHSRTWNEDNSWHGNSIVLRVSLWNRPASDSSAKGWTVWMSDLQTLEESKYYEIFDNWYVDDLEVALEAQETRYSRLRERAYKGNSPVILDSDKAREIGRKFLKRFVGYKRVSTSEVVVKRYESHRFYRYSVSYKGHEYRLYVK